ncbi:MAG: type II toxin-antitoxin system VapC family toxin [Jatrophihabitantaceae bacterium]
MTRCYLDSSVALHLLIPGGSGDARVWLDATLRADGEVYSSTLLALELTRVLRRELLDVALARVVLDRVQAVSIDDGILRAAAAIEPHVKSLDAIHLATCQLLGGGLSFVTHDAKLADVAVTLGFDVIDPVKVSR